MGFEKETQFLEEIDRTLRRGLEETQILEVKNVILGGRANFVDVFFVVLTFS